MISVRNNWFLLHTVDRYRPRFFFEQEWRWHVLLMPLLFPIANYYFIGLPYVNSLSVFMVGTMLAFGLYWLSVITLTLAIRWAIRHYPGMRQTRPRIFVMLFLAGSLTTGLAIIYVWTYSLFPITGVRFGWAVVRPVWIVGLLSDAFLCIILGLFYSYAQWKQELQEDEQLQRQALQNQYDTLKAQLNPHFLFNALNSISVLIGEEPQQAEQFVDKMARVYRYMLQSGRPTMRNGRETALASSEKNEFVTLQAELDFITLYADLLQIRYGSSFRVDQVPINNDTYLSRGVLPLSLLTLIDNAVKHNTMSVSKPLVITIEITPDGLLQVSNNRQQKVIRLETVRGGLASLITRYDLLSPEAVRVEATDTHFSVILPLLALST